MQMQFIDVKGGGRTPVLGLGTARLRGRECTQAVRIALDLGYRHIDTAELYANEREIGEAIATSSVDRAELFVTTKIWTSHFRALDARRAAETSLRNLRTDYVDLLLMHFPNESVPLEETLGALAGLVEAGKVLAIGVSNFSTPLLEKAIAACPVPIACDQVRYHIGYDQSQLLAFARPRGIFIIAYSPLGVGSLAHLTILKEIARKHDRNPVQIALRWLIEQDGVMAIPKATNKRHLQANINIFDFALDSEDRARLDKVAGPGAFARLVSLARLARSRLAQIVGLTRA
jgi:2,5-diketo-D-gluconate reductase B